MPRPDITAHINANSKGFHDAMARIRRDSKVTADSSGAAFSALNDKLRGGVKAALAGVTVAAGIKLFIDQAKKAVAEIQEIESAAKTAGVGFEDFQELSYAAKKNLVSVDALTDGLKEMQLRVDEVVRTGKGPAAESLGRLGFSARELGEALKQPDRLFEDILGRMKQLDKAAQIRVADEIFGGSAGEQFVRMLDEARGSIADNRKEAQDLGLVIEEDLLDRVKELDKAWGDVYDTVTTRLNRGLLITIGYIGTALDRMRELQDQTTGTLSGRQTEIMGEKADLGARLREINSPESPLNDRNRQRARNLIEQRIAELNAEEDAIIEMLEKRNIPASFKPPQTPIIEDPSLGSGSGSSKISEAERQRKRILELIAALEHEGRTLKMNETDQRIANELRKAGALVTPEQTETIMRLVRANEAEKQSREAANKELERQSDIYNRFGGEVESTIDGLIDKSLTLEQALVKVGIAAVKALLDINRVGGSSGGGIGGLIASALSRAFGGGGSSAAVDPWAGMRMPTFAQGGVSNRPAIFAEAGPEAAVPLPDGRRIPVDLRGAGGGGGDVHVAISIPIDATGADAAGLARLSEEVSKLRQEMPGRIVTTVQDAQKRRVLK